MHLLSATTEITSAVPDDSKYPPHEGWLGTPWELDATETKESVGNLNFDWLIVDHYALDKKWESQARRFSEKIMVIDDLVDREHDCDVLLDQTFGRMADEYRPYVPDCCDIFTGSDYVLLRPEFCSLRQYSFKRRIHPRVKRLAVILGGSEQSELIGGILEELRTCSLPADCLIKVVLGSSGNDIDFLYQMAANFNWPIDFEINVPNLGQIMADSDLIIGAAGSTAWERCCLGVPCIMFVLAENQRDVARSLAEAGAVSVINTIDELHHSIELLTKSTERLVAMSESARSIIDGSGTENVVNFLVRTCG